jgi:hypothetical protein
VSNCVPCLSNAARELLAPRQVVRIALLGNSRATVRENAHLLIEFAHGAPAVSLDEWLRWQRELGRRCGCTVELVSVNRLEERVAADVVTVTVLYDSSSDG